MANTIQIKRTNIASRVPGAGGIAAIGYGELAINVNDKKLYYGNASGATTDIMEVITKATTSVLGKASFEGADFNVSSGVVTIDSVSNAQLAGSIGDGKLLTISAENKVSLSALNIDGGTAITGGTLAAADLIVVDDNASGTNRKATLGNLGTLLAGNGLAVSGATLAVGVDGSTIEINSDALRVKAAGILSAHIADNQVDTQHIATDAIVGAAIDDNVITTAHIQNNTITSDDLKQTDGGEAVTTATIRAGAVTNTEIANDAINGAKIADNAIDSDHYTDGSIDTVHIGNNQVTGDKLADSITIAQDLTVTGDLTVSGASTVINTATLAVEDTFIELNRQAESAQSSSNIEDTRDIGIYAAYDSNSAAGSDLYLYTGIGRDASLDKWVFFTGLDTEPSATPGAVTMGNTVARTGTVQANLEGISSSLFCTMDKYTIDCGTF